MSSTNYKYSPSDFEGMPLVSEELEDFYRLYQNWTKDKSRRNKFELDIHWENFFFTIKAREVEGFLSPRRAADLREYLEELVYGD